MDQLYTTLQVTNITRISSTIGDKQRNGSIIHDVTSVKYIKENEIFSQWLTSFPE